jgi:glycosyltransferase involved in cell wall biosynthesis
VHPALDTELAGQPEQPCHISRVAIAEHHQVRVGVELGVERRVHLVGPVPGPEVPVTLADADVAVVYVRPICLSYRYSLPNKLFESIHAGLPIVAADLPDTAAIVQTYGVGDVFGSDRPDQLAGAIERVIADEARYRAASVAAADQLDWTYEADALVRLYAHVLENAP